MERHMAQEDRLFYPDTVYVSEARTQDEVFAEVSKDLLAKGLVKDAFLENILEREAGYPTGMNMAPLSDRLPNFAVPHTEVEYVNTCRLVPVRLLRPVTWHDMISPDDSFDVSFLFMILNDDAEAQVGILARIMDFVNASGVDTMVDFFNLDDPRSIYDYLVAHFPQKAE
jgi:PTS system galactitol-specific IIA component